MLFRKLARSTTSGSRAAFSIKVVPSAKAAAIIRFSVPVTETISIRITAPFNLFALALIYPFSTSISAPIALRPSMCRLTGRDPIAQPPGSDTSAVPNFANKGPSTNIDARMVLTKSYGAT